MIEVQDVTKRYNEFAALEGVSLSVPAGSLTALLGPSAAASRRSSGSSRGSSSRTAAEF